MNKDRKPFGTWPSVISAELVTRGIPSLNFVQSQGEQIYWVESRPWEAGRNVIMCRSGDGSIRDLLPPPFSHNSRVHEYGGMAYAITDSCVYFVNAADQRIYQVDLTTNHSPIPITAPGPRFADLIIDHKHHRLVAVCEEHSNHRKPENYLAEISLDGQENCVQRLIFGADFYAYPRISPDGQKLCWIEWQHPNMPWDNTQLWQANIDARTPTDLTPIAGENDDEAIFQPHWSPDNQLFFVSDKENWWNIYSVDSGIVIAVCAEFATPLWQFGMATYDFVDESTIACRWTQQGIWHTGLIDITTGQLTVIDNPYTTTLSACYHHNRFYFIGAGPALANEIVGMNKQGSLETIYAPSTINISIGHIAQPQSIHFPTADNEIVQAFYYPPTHDTYQGEQDELPPLIVLCHGGPTGATDSSFNLKIQYWTNRGFAVVDINYRGSTGFGRDYRQLLVECWGIADTKDAEYTIAYLGEQLKIDSQRCIIRGGSAGGYTVLSALTFTDTFQAGASLYGIGDLETLASDTHKFESYYLHKLIGPYPQCRDIYVKRSPIHHTDKLNCPVIFLQGLEDKVVPPNQAEIMVQALQQKDIEVAHITFADEGHGFKKADNIIQALEAEYNFYRKIFQLSD